jgi:hypothetical protein
VKVLASAADLQAPIAQIRLVEPLQALARTRPAVALRLLPWHACGDDDLAWADVLVIQRAVNARALGLIERMKAGGGRVVFEIDDLLTEPAPSLQAHDQLLQAQAVLRRGLEQADAVSVSTARLGRRLAPLVQRWHEVPNHGIDCGLHARQPRQGAWPTVVLASSDRVALGPAAVALQALQAAGGGPRVVAVGPVAADLAAAGVVVQAEPLRPRAQFLTFIAALPDPVALVPLGDTSFDACKSAIKFFDFALLGVPVLASDRPPYSDVVRHGDAGLLLPDDAAAWEQALRRLRDEPSLGAALAAPAEAQVRALHGLGHSVAAWAALLDSLPPRSQAAPAVPTWRRWLQNWQARLRQANRERLARRARRG